MPPAGKQLLVGGRINRAIMVPLFSFPITVFVGSHINRVIWVVTVVVHVVPVISLNQNELMF